MKPTILIVDDETDVRTTLGEALAKDYCVVLADSGFDGLSEVMVGEEKIDLVITDLNMPGLNGLELVENLPEGIPVIIISGFLHLPEFQNEVQHLHSVALLEKPFPLEKLREAIQKALEQ